MEKPETPGSIVDYEGNRAIVGDRVELHPATDWWMRGARYGIIKALKMRYSGDPVAVIRLDNYPRRSIHFLGRDFRKITVAQMNPDKRKRRANPTRREGYRFGTSHFVSREAAVRYYAEYGENAADVDRKLREGIIAIGAPKVKRYEKLSIIPGEGRYQIERLRTVRVPSARRSAASAEALKRIRRENPSRYQGRNVYKMTAQKPGGKVLTLVQGNKFAERGKPVLFAEHGSAWATAQWLQDQFPALRRYTILVTNK